MKLLKYINHTMQAHTCFLMAASMALVSEPKRDGLPPLVM